MPPLANKEAEEGALSILASATYSGSTKSIQRSLLRSEDASMGSIICRALANLQMDFPQASHTLIKAFFRC